MPDPRVSVIASVYNVAPYVREALDSVLAQSWTDLELIVIDDGSTDDTVREIEGIRDRRLRLLRQEHIRTASARNAGLRQARGRYIALMDGDDVWLPRKLERDVAYLDGHAEVHLVFSAMRLVDEQGHDLGRTIREWSGVVALRDLLIENVIGSDTVVMRRESCQRIGFFDEDLGAAEDYDYWLRAALQYPGGLHGSPRISALYRRRPGQLTRNQELQERVWQRIIEKARLRSPQDVAAVEARSRANFYRAMAAVDYENGVDSAFRRFRDAVGYSPGFLLKDRRTWLLGSALLSERLLPKSLHRRLEKWARKARIRTGPAPAAN